MATKQLSVVGFGLFLALATATAQAIPLSYSEAVSGDLASSPGSAFLFATGDNQVSGTTHLAVNDAPNLPHFDTDFDTFVFQVPAGTQLASISVSFTTTSYNASKADDELRFCLSGGECTLSDAGLLGAQTLSFLGASPTLIDFGLAFPLDAGSYTLRSSGLGIAPVDVSIASESWSADYTWTLSVVSVPEPAVPWLFGLAVFFLLVGWLPSEMNPLPRPPAISMNRHSSLPFR